MMYDFKDYYEATGIRDAVNHLAGNPNARIIAGGTDVLIRLRERSGKFVGKDLVGITRIPELREIHMDKSGDILIGSACSFTAVENHPLIRRSLASLSVAAGSVGGPQVRNCGTVGGNICNGATSADTAPALFTYGALLVLESPRGRREIPITEFYTGPGKVVLNQDDLLVAVKIKKCDYEGYRGHYIKFAQRRAMDISTLGCAVWLKTDPKGEVIEDLRVAFGVAGPTPLRARTAEAYARGKATDRPSLEKIGGQCLRDTSARDSWRGSKLFREQLIQELPARAIGIALERGSSRA